MPLLRTKLNIPRLFSDLLERPRLIEKLDRGAKRRLTLVSAPAGFGKTTILSSWAAGTDIPLAWISLDEHDNDPVRFWSYFITALRALADEHHGPTAFGKTALAMLQAQQPPTMETILTELLNDISSLSYEFVLVLDDYQSIAFSDIHEGMAFFIDNLAPQAHIFIASRSEPPLPLPRWRVRNELVEITVADIRFTPAETGTFLNLITGLNLDTDAINILDNLTEGWAAALKLAAISMYDPARSMEFVKSFSGDSRFIFDYFAEEVLSRQPEDLRRFLLQTAVLERLNASLCDAVTGSSGSLRKLEKLEQSNLFLMPLDQHREWYRYHRLFADFLWAQLNRIAAPEEIAGLRHNAMNWYEQHGLVFEAITQAFLVPDFETAARLIKQAAPALFQDSELLTLIHWFESFPREIIGKDPELSLMFAWALLATGKPEAVEVHLADIEQTLGIKAGDYRECNFVIPLNLVAGQILCLRANMAIHQGNYPRTLELSRSADICLSAESGPEQAAMARSFLGTVKFNMAVAFEMTGDIAAADEAFNETISLEGQNGNPHIVVIAHSHRAQIQAVRGNLHRAEELYRQAIDRIAPLDHPSPLSGTLYVGLGSVYKEWNRLEEASALLTQGLQLGRSWNNWETVLPGSIGLAEVKAATGDTRSALDIIDALTETAGKMEMGAPLSLIRGYRLLLDDRDRRTEIDRWLDETGTDSDESSFFEQEPLYLLRARLLIAAGRYRESLELAGRLKEEAQAGGRGGRVIETLVIESLALYHLGKKQAALDVLITAVSAGSAEGYTRVFLNGGPPVFELLNQAVSRNIQIEYALRLTTQFGLPGSNQAGLAEPLSERELEVLRLLAGNLNNREIAERLIVSVNTVKTHLKNIYGKLNARNRAEAVTRAGEIGLIKK